MPSDPAGALGGYHKDSGGSDTPLRYSEPTHDPFVDAEEMGVLHEILSRPPSETLSGNFYSSPPRIYPREAGPNLPVAGAMPTACCHSTRAAAQRSPSEQ